MTPWRPDSGNSSADSQEKSILLVPRGGIHGIPGKVPVMRCERCSQENAGLKICIRSTRERIPRDAPWDVGLVFKNTSDRPLRIYFVRNEVFRSFQSRFWILVRGKPVPITRVSPPHGYVVTEKDFHWVEAKSEILFHQALSLAEAGLEKDIETFTLQWAYENTLSRWEGGVQTLDGITKALFGGKEILSLWRGELEASMDFILENGTRPTGE